MGRSLPRGESGLGNKELFQQGLRDSSFQQAKKSGEEAEPRKPSREVEYTQEDLTEAAAPDVLLEDIDRNPDESHVPSSVQERLSKAADQQFLEQLRSKIKGM